MRGLLASGILLSLAVLAIGFAGGLIPLFGTTDYPWECGQLCRRDFWQAATLEDVRAELEDGKDVNRIRASDGNTPLHLAVRWRVSPEIVELLLAAGADPNASGFREVHDHLFDPELVPRTPLQTATEYGEHTPEVIRLLLEYGADPNPPINPDNSRFGSLAPLTYSLRGAERHRAAIVEILLKYGADTEVPGWWHYEEEGATALHLAATVADPAILELFLKYGADFHVRSDPDGYYAGYADGTVLHAAAKMNPHPESIEFLIEQGIDVNAVTRNGETPLHLAGKNANSEVMRVLLEHGADPNARTSSGSTPLLWAIGGYPCEDALYCQKVVALLLDSGSDPNARRANARDGGRTPLHSSIIEKRDAKVIETLLNHGADGTAKFHRWVGESSLLSAPLAPLHLAAYVGSPTGVIEVLIDRGADVNARVENGLTPLHLAAGNNDNSHIVQYLLSRAADSNARDENGDTPLHLAAKGDLCKRDEVHCEFLFSFLLYNSADANALNDEGNSPLHVVISRALDHRLVWMLLEFGADPALMNSEGATALHMALALPRYNRDEPAHALEIVHAVLDSGVDVNIRSGPATGSQEKSLGLATPLHWAVFHARFDVEFLKLLVRQGADLQATNQLGETPCQLTTRLGRGAL